MSTLLDNLDKIHTTLLGIERIKGNLELKINNDKVVAWCKEGVSQAKDIRRIGKNFYVHTSDNAIITINAHSYTIITAHKKKPK
jgi:hypothetical protein